jgi:hypothetical protein
MMTQRGEIISTTYHEGMWHGERTVAYSNGSVNTAYYKRGKKASAAEIENFKLEL